MYIIVWYDIVFAEKTFAGGSLLFLPKSTLYLYHLHSLYKSHTASCRSLVGGLVSERGHLAILCD